MKNENCKQNNIQIDSFKMSIDTFKMAEHSHTDDSVELASDDEGG